MPETTSKAGGAVAHFPLLVPGATAAAEHREVRSPYDGQLLATVEQADGAAVEQAFTTAARLFAGRDAWLPPARRIEILQATAAIMTERREELALEAAREGGKPLMDSLVEADRAIEGVKLCVETLRTQGGTEIPMNLTAASAGRAAFTQLEPAGVVLAFSAFNHPLNLIVHQAAPAVAAGCPVIVKPAEVTPLSCMRFVGILREAGLPEPWCQALVTTDLDLAASMVADERVSFFSFIGSAEVGWRLRSRLAPGARCALEHGGVAPVIVAADADIDDALPLLAKAGFYHAGQVCVSVQRIFAHRSIARKVADALARRADALNVGDPTSPDTEVGPIIRAEALQRIGEWVAEAVEQGADLLSGGQPASETCYAPTVLFDPPPETRVSTLEVFGPVVCVYPFDELDDAVARANALPYTFQAGVFTRDLDTALRATRRLSATAVMINDHTAFRVDWMPFGGRRHSGLGVGGIPYSMKDMQAEKMVVFRSRELT
jgi:acyl-CoA reductase-like NAD-dependent aldehyde dehydrogenase